MTIFNQIILVTYRDFLKNEKDSDLAYFKAKLVLSLIILAYCLYLYCIYIKMFNIPLPALSDNWKRLSIVVYGFPIYLLVQHFCMKQAELDEFNQKLEYEIILKYIGRTWVVIGVAFLLLLIFAIIL